VRGEGGDGETRAVAVYLGRIFANALREVRAERGVSVGDVRRVRLTLDPE